MLEPTCCHAAGGACCVAGLFCRAMQLLLAVSVAALVPVLAEAFAATAKGKISARASPFPSRTALSAKQRGHIDHMTTTMAAAIVGGGRIGCALYVSTTRRSYSCELRSEVCPPSSQRVECWRQTPEPRAPPLRSSCVTSACLYRST